MPVMTDVAPGQKALRFKMRLNADNFMSEYGGWLKAGDIVIVDEDTAVRWLENHIAVQAGRDEKTAAEIRREKLRAQLVAIDEEEAERAERATVRKTQAQMPRRRGRPPVRPELVGAGVVNSLDDVPDEIGDDGDGNGED